jgi:pSer/pThr/pTyr-binding forkhead associated (FHA) protein
LRDLGSTNGTYVNDRRVDQHELVDNDFVQFGKSLVKFKTL